MINVLARLRIKQGKDAEFLESCRTLAAIAANEETTLVYEYFVDPASSRALVVERYPDSASMERHMANNAEAAAAGIGNYDVEHLDICGPVGKGVRDMFTTYYGSNPAVGLIFYDFAISK